VGRTGNYVDNRLCAPLLDRNDQQIYEGDILVGCNYTDRIIGVAAREDKVPFGFGWLNDEAARWRINVTHRWSKNKWRPGLGHFRLFYDNYGKKSASYRLIDETTKQEIEQ
jgi:hypothetical protein